MNRVKMSAAALLCLASQMDAVTIFNNSGVERQVLIQQFSTDVHGMFEVIWNKGEQEKSFRITTVLKPETMACSSLPADQAANFEIMKDCKTVVVTVYWGSYNAETNKWEFEKSAVLSPADYEKTEFIDNESMILIHQATQEEALKIKLMGKKLGAIMQQKMIAKVFENEAAESAAAK